MHIFFFLLIYTKYSEEILWHIFKRMLHVTCLAHCLQSYDSLLRIPNHSVFVAMPILTYHYLRANLTTCLLAFIGFATMFLAFWAKRITESADTVLRLRRSPWQIPMKRQISENRGEKHMPDLGCTFPSRAPGVFLYALTWLVNGLSLGSVHCQLSKLV